MRTGRHNSKLKAKRDGTGGGDEVGFVFGQGADEHVVARATHAAEILQIGCDNSLGVRHPLVRNVKENVAVFLNYPFIFEHADETDIAIREQLAVHADKTVGGISSHKAKYYATKVVRRLHGITVFWFDGLKKQRNIHDGSHGCVSGCKGAACATPCVLYETLVTSMMRAMRSVRVLN